MALAIARLAYDMVLALAILVVPGCTAFALQRDHAVPRGRGNPTRHTAAVFLQERDCTTNMALLQLLSRSEFSNGLSVVVYDVGESRSADRVTARLRAMDLPFPALPAPRGSVSQLRRMGYDATPVLVLVDSADRVRMAAAAPATLAEMRRLESALRILTDSLAPPSRT